MVQSGWADRMFPNASTAADPAPFVGFDCGDLGCLFDIANDPSETNDIRAEFSEKRTELLGMIEVSDTSVFSPNRGLEVCPPSSLAFLHRRPLQNPNETFPNVPT